MIPNEIYISPEGFVQATVDVDPLFQSGISRYPLTKGEWYKLSVAENSPTANYRDKFIWIENSQSKRFPHKKEYFLTVEVWRESQLSKLLSDNSSSSRT